MGAKLTVFYWYQIKQKRAINEVKNILLRCVRPEFPNYSQALEDRANEKLEEQQAKLLKEYLEDCYAKRENPNIDVVCLGNMQVDTFGDDLFGDKKRMIDIYVADTKYGHPWIVLGQADSKTDFIEKMNNDAIYDTQLGILSLEPLIDTLRRIRVKLLF